MANRLKRHLDSLGDKGPLIKTLECMIALQNARTIEEKRALLSRLEIYRSAFAAQVYNEVERPLARRGILPEGYISAAWNVTSPLIRINRER